MIPEDSELVNNNINNNNSLLSASSSGGAGGGGGSVDLGLAIRGSHRIIRDMMSGPVLDSLCLSVFDATQIDTSAQ